MSTIPRVDGEPLYRAITSKQDIKCPEMLLLLMSDSKMPFWPMRTCKGHVFVITGPTKPDVIDRFAQALLAREAGQDTLYFCPFQ